MSLIRFIILATLFLMLAALPSQSTQALAPNVETQFSCANVTEIPQLECEALVDIYNSTDGPNWTEQEGWLTTTTPCSWYGVTCNGGSVITLDLGNDNNGNGLSGALPATIGNLSNITVLNFSSNELSSVPAEIGNLSGLTGITLSSNKLSSLPAEIGNLSSLIGLDLHSNQLSSVPTEIGNLSNLMSLHLQFNELSSVPAEIGNLSNLTLLNLESNKLNSIPAEIANLSNLTKLNLSFNQVSNLPAEIDNLSNLTLFDLRFNQLSSVPAEIGNLSSLTTLDLRSNQLSSVPAEIGNLSSLTILNVSFNQLSSLPVEIGNLSSLTKFYLYSNQLSSVPAEIGNLSNLTGLDLHSNKLSSVPAEIGNLSNLKWLHLESNELSSVPGEISNLSNLNELYLEFNQLTTLPANFVNLMNLFFLDLADNHLNVTDEALLAWMAANDPDWAETQAPQAASTPIPTVELTSTVAPSSTPILTPTITSTPTPIFTPIPEPASRCDLAVQVNSTDIFHEEGFETAFDIDWFTFDGIADTPYRIDVEIPSGSAADVNLELYPDCDQGPVDKWVESFSPSVELDFTPTITGPVYLRLTNADDSQFGDHLRYQLSVRQLNQESGTGAVIIVAGRLKSNDRLQQNIYTMTDKVHAIFQEQSYTPEDIYYLAPEAEEVNHYDAAANIANLRSAITTWAAERIKLPDVPDVLTIYMMDHGDIDLFYLDGPRGEVLRPKQLDGWLDILEADIPDIKINVIIEACHAGSFIQAPGSISGPNRVIITSSDQENDAYASADGAYFSDQFLTALREGDHLFGSWSRATDVVEDLFIVFPQRPWMDSNGNGIHNEREDFAEASRRGFGYTGTLNGSEGKLWPPYIAHATPPDSLEGDSALIRAEVRDDRRVDHVWAVIYPPSYEPLTQDNELVSEELETILLASQGGDQYQGRAYNFTESGTYRIVLHADDADELLARPVVVEFSTDASGRQVYLPWISR